MNVIFWNTQNKPVDELLVLLANSYGVDLFVLSEYPSKESSFIENINTRENSFIEIPQIGCQRITIFIRSELANFEHGPESSYYTSKKLTFSPNLTLLMVAVHLPSKLYQSEETQMLEAVEFKREIEDCEKRLNTRNTFIIGDFNMNPFETGMVAASAFHSIPCLQTALSKNGKRKATGREHNIFYNPMWNLLGDFDGNPGTYFRSGSEQKVYFWNILDQVILRPNLAKHLEKGSLKILRSIGEKQLVNSNGRPALSDHLPINFNLTLEEEIEND